MVTPDDTSITVEWNTADRRRWSRLLDNVPFASYQQDFAYGEMLERIGAPVQRGVIADAEGPLALAQLQIRSFFGLAHIAMVMLGPVWLRDDLSAQTRAAALRALAKTAPLPPRTGLLVMPAEADPAPFALMKAPRMVSSYHTAMVDLAPDEASLRKTFRGKWRNRLVSSEKSDLQTRLLPHQPDAYQWLLDHETTQRKRARYQGIPVQMVPMFQSVAGPKSVIALVAELDGARVAGCLFLRHGNSATYHIGWSSPDGKAVSAHNLLLWKAICHLKQAKVRTLDLGGLTGERGDGIVRFKLGTGAEPISQAGTFLLKPAWR